MHPEKSAHPWQQGDDLPTQPLLAAHRGQSHPQFSLILPLLTGALLFLVCLAGICYALLGHSFLSRQQERGGSPVAQRAVSSPRPFDPAIGAVLPAHRVVAFYAIPGAQVTGPAYHLDIQMLKNLRAQAATYERIDPAHSVLPGIDLVVSIPDSSPGAAGTYSHHLDAQTIQRYVAFCQRYGLLLFLDLDFGQAPIQAEVNFFLPYLERYSFVEMAIDPEWMFPRHDGIPGVNLSNVRASDLNPVIQTLARLPMAYHMPRKVLLIHQYRGDGDGLRYPFAAGQAEIADKRHLLFDPRVDVVIHVDGVGGYTGDRVAKTWEYHLWVARDMQLYHNFRYGGFKLFYHIEATTLMTPQEVMALKPRPMVITYGN
ncbi:MAG TPA: hypothetical protein VGF67_00535 [Ktedonobacteraceae bacterium]